MASNLLEDLVAVLKNAQATGTLPTVSVDTKISLDDVTILKFGAAVFVAVLIPALIVALILRKT